MARTNSRQRAYDAVKLFEGMGKTVKSISFLKAGEFKLEFTTSDDEEYNSLDHIDWSAKAYKPEKKPRRGSLEALQERKRQEKEKKG